MREQKDFYAPDEVAERLGVHVRTVRRFIREGGLHAARVGKQYRIAAQDLNEFIGTRENSAATAPASRQRRVIVSTTVDIDAIGLDETQRLTTLLTGAFRSRREEERGQSLNCIYYEEQGRLRIVVNAGLDFTTAVLGVINGVLQTGPA